jgi:hypothetical protein
MGRGVGVAVVTVGLLEGSPAAGRGVAGFPDLGVGSAELGGAGALACGDGPAGAVIRDDTGGGVAEGCPARGRDSIMTEAITKATSDTASRLIAAPGIQVLEDGGSALGSGPATRRRCDRI